MNPVSEDVAVAQYKLATFQYTQDLLHDAASHVKAATQLLRARYPEQHPLVGLGEGYGEWARGM